GEQRDAHHRQEQRHVFAEQRSADLPPAALLRHRRHDALHLVAGRGERVLEAIHHRATSLTGEFASAAGTAPLFPSPLGEGSAGAGPILLVAPDGGPRRATPNPDLAAVPGALPTLQVIIRSPRPRAAGTPRGWSV